MTAGDEAASATLGLFEMLNGVCFSALFSPLCMIYLLAAV